MGLQLSDTAREELRDFQSKVDDTSTAVANFGAHAGDAEKFLKLFENFMKR